MRNVFACLVHEAPDCVEDLVRNLRFLDPESAVLLYRGGDAAALDSLAMEQMGAVVHPFPKPMKWGSLHEFALDCMRFSLGHLPFDTLTIVDSDQLLLRAGYSACLQAARAESPAAGVFGSVAQVLPPDCAIGPVPAAYQEIDLWRPFLRRFPDGEAKFPHWSFWPATVFTADAARDLTRLIDADDELRQILRRSRIWATEEILLPTLAALLGHEVAPKPSSNNFVQYRAPYSVADVDAALSSPDVYWMHPVARRFDDPVRASVRDFHAGYGGADRREGVRRMRLVPGWLEDDEAEVLVDTVFRVGAFTGSPAIVEAGCFCGRTTVVLGRALLAGKLNNPIYSIDVHDGLAGALDQGLRAYGPTRARFEQAITANRLVDVVCAIEGRPAEVEWRLPIGLLVVDALHDYESVAADFAHFEKWIEPGGFAAFHDYAGYFPGVQRFVDELLSAGRYRKVALAGTMMVVQKALGAPAITGMRPLVSCIMPTYNRRPFVPQAIQYFLQQEYAAKELLIVDDGSDCVADLVPAHPAIRYVRLPERQSMGAKHNLACEMARGDIIVHMDDDDWNAAWRVSYQVEELARCPAEALCGLARVLFYEPATRRAWEYNYPVMGRPWVYGATFCYRKSFWERHRFPDMNEGADTTFVWNLEGVDVCAHENHRFLVATVHTSNTSPKRTVDIGWQPRTESEIHHVVDDAGRAFYGGLTA